MRLHVLAGAPALLGPERLPLVELAGLIGPRVRPATAFWLLPGHADHDFLLQEAGDARVAVFARALAENFGARFEPLVVLPDLLADGAAAARSRAVAAELWGHRPAAALTLHGLALPEGVDAGDGWAAPLRAPRLQERLAGLRDRLAGPGDRAIATLVTEVGPEAAGFAALMRNALAAAVAALSGERLAAAGLAARDGRLRAALAGLLADWHRAGLEPRRPLGGPELERIAARLTEALLLRGGPADG